MKKKNNKINKLEEEIKKLDKKIKHQKWINVYLLWSR